MLLLLAAAAFATAALSATFGMLGGLVLMGAFTAVLPVPEAMVLHGLTQLVAHVSRVVTHRRSLRVGGLAAYGSGALVATGIAAMVAFTPGQAAIYLGLGAIPFIARLVPPSRWLDASTPAGAAVAGLVVVGTQSAFGVAGPLLDLFFLTSDLDRHGVVATKSATQVISQVLKVARFAPLVAWSPRLGLTVAVCTLAAAFGTHVGTLLLERFSEAGFRRATRTLVLVVGGVYLGLGAAALA